MKNLLTKNKVVSTANVTPLFLTQKVLTKKVLAVTLSCLLLCLSVANAQAGKREQAKRIYERLAGIQPTESILLDMESEIPDTNPGSATTAALKVINGQYDRDGAGPGTDDTAGLEGFLGGTLKRMAAPWTNRDQDAFEPLNDYMATFIGLVKDDEDYRRILYDDVVYHHPAVSPGYSPNNNNHYIAIEDQAAPLRDLDDIPQSSVQPIPPEATAGVMTSRAGARAFFYLGTNRAMLRFTLMSQTCRDLEQMQDEQGVPDRIRQDVSRSPGGDSTLFFTRCATCHIGMDPLAQAFAYYNYVDPDEDPTTDDGAIVYNTTAQPNDELGIDTRVQPKYHINANNFPYGYLTLDDSWDNYWREGSNRAMGWDYGDDSPGGSGNGAKSMGRELANSYAFAQCQVRKVFKAVCLREPSASADQTKVADMTNDFRDGGYRLKPVFAETADYCKGD